MEENIDFLTGSKLALENAKRLISCADAIAATAEYGPANSLLILAVEECVKSGFLSTCAISGIFPGDPNELIKLLRQHKHKHYFGFITRLMVETAAVMMADEKILSRIDERFRGVDESDIESILQRFEELTGELVSEIMNNFQVAAPGNEELGDKEWWRNANLLRNRGFYTDYENNNWIVPTTISKTDFEKTREMALKLITEIEEYYKIKNPEVLSILRRIISTINTKLGSSTNALPDEL